ncbi:hypothetical protein [Paenibacillus radicibacter]|uniref:hypothetical protein n=1 Tax=Paenibacillus radicibacter TaxID=2972488 RepID=UPI0021594B3F|nr:hypothetical protein [Paenibacillus radicibacter]
MPSVEGRTGYAFKVNPIDAKVRANTEPMSEGTEVIENPDVPGEYVLVVRPIDRDLHVVITASMEGYNDGVYEFNMSSWEINPNSVLFEGERLKFSFSQGNSNVRLNIISDVESDPDFLGDKVWFSGDGRVLIPMKSGWGDMSYQASQIEEGEEIPIHDNSFWGVNIDYNLEGNKNMVFIKPGTFKNRKNPSNINTLITLGPFGSNSDIPNPLPYRLKDSDSYVELGIIQKNEEIKSIIFADESVWNEPEDGVVYIQISKEKLINYLNSEPGNKLKLIINGTSEVINIEFTGLIKDRP